MVSEKVINKFKSLFNNQPLVVRSPGRINLIGEHTDYNDGYVLPAAINKEIVCAVALNFSDQINLYSLDLDEMYSIKIGELAPSGKGWPDYILGVLAQFKKGGQEIEGFDCVFGGDVPLGAGLSSSAALECAFAFAFNEIWNSNIDKIELVKMAQMAEHEYAGVKCGIMDQFASMFGKKDQVIRLDCKTLDYAHFTIKLSDYQIVLCDSHVKHSLASSAYNTRREECETGVQILSKYYPGVTALRQATLEQLEAHKNEFDPVVFKRCEYVVKENKRVLEATKLLQQHDLEGFGNLMYQTHSGLSQDYEVSCKELDFLVDYTKNLDYVLGSRMMGGGFGGCTINLVKIEKIDEFIEKIGKDYKDKTGIDMPSYHVTIENGTSKY